MESLLQSLAVSQVYVFMLVFVRIGTAVMLMPGVGDGFVPERVRLLFALAFAAVISPVVSQGLPVVPVGGPAFMVLLLGEFLVGALIGLIARIFMTVLDTAGMLISMQMGLANAQIFNPAMATQGSIMGAFFSLLGAVLLFGTNMHHMVLGGIVQSYESFPAGGLPATWSGDFASLIARALADAFAIGFQISLPFMVIMMLIYIVMGVFSRLMPQLQVFLLSMPVQIIVGLITLVLVLSAGMMFWLSHYNEAYDFLMPASGGG